MEYTNNFNIPQVVIDAIVADKYEVDPLKNIYSVSSLISPPKIRQLFKRHIKDIKRDISEDLWIFLGKMGHRVFENVSDVNRLKEERISVSYGGYNITGKSDLYDGDTKSITDFKFTSVWNYIYNPNGKEEWVNQLNLYAWLFRKYNFEVNFLRILCILRDWMKSKAKSDIDYPKIPFVEIKIDLWDFEKQEKFLIERLTFHEKQNNLSDDEITICNEKERWTRPTSYAILKEGNKKATKVFEDKEIANKELEIIKEKNKKDSYILETREGIDVRCVDYCDVSQFCNYWKGKYAKE